MWLGALWWCMFCPVDPRGLFYINWYKSWPSSGTLLAYFRFLFIHPWIVSFHDYEEYTLPYAIQVWDGTQCKKVRTMGGHQTRTGVLAWNSRILASGSRDRNILQHDMRVSGDFISKLVGHKSEVKIFWGISIELAVLKTWILRNW